MNERRRAGLRNARNRHKSDRVYQAATLDNGRERTRDMKKLLAILAITSFAGGVSACTTHIDDDVDDDEIEIEEEDDEDVEIDVDDDDASV